MQFSLVAPALLILSNGLSVIAAPAPLPVPVPASIAAPVLPGFANIPVPIAFSLPVTTSPNATITAITAAVDGFASQVYKVLGGPHCAADATKYCPPGTTCFYSSSLKKLSCCPKNQACTQ